MYRADSFGNQDDKQKQILDQLNQFRQNPSMAIPILRSRIERYRTRKGKTSIVSLNGKRKIPIREEDSPNQRIQDLINLIEKNYQRMPSLRKSEKLNEVSAKIFKILEDSGFKNIQLSPQQKRSLRNILKEDEDFEYPDDITCMVSLSFDEKYEVLSSLLVDDDIPSRKNRQILFDESKSRVGIVSKNVPEKENLRCTIILSTGQIKDKERWEEKQEQKIASPVPFVSDRGDPSKIKVLVDSDNQEINEIKSPGRARKTDWTELGVPEEKVKIQQYDEEILMDRIKNSSHRGYSFGQFRDTFVRESNSPTHENNQRIYGSQVVQLEESSIEPEQRVSYTRKRQFLDSDY